MLRTYSHKFPRYHSENGYLHDTNYQIMLIDFLKSHDECAQCDKSR